MPGLEVGTARTNLKMGKADVFNQDVYIDGFYWGEHLGLVLIDEATAFGCAGTICNSVEVSR